MTDAQLIDHLVGELRPVQRLPSPARRAAVWMLVALVYVLGTAMALGLRADLTETLARPRFLLEIGAVLVAAGGAALWAFQRSIPGRTARPCALVVAFAAVAWFASVQSHPAPDGSSGWTCVVRWMVLAGVPGLVGFRLLQRSEPLEPRLVYRMGAVAAGVLALVGTRLVCSKDGTEHLLLWHAVPAVLAVALAELRRICAPAAPRASVLSMGREYPARTRARTGADAGARDH